MSLILIVLISIFVSCLILMFLSSILFTKLDKVVELLQEEEEEEDDDVIDCPHCKSIDRLFVPIHWKLTMPGIGQCPECMKTWQNYNTKEHPLLKEVFK